MSHTIFMITKEQPTGHFDDLGIDKKILSIFTKNGFDAPTPIQQQVIPSALTGKDVIGIAQTGTGKTFAFGVPMIQRIALSKRQGLILLPTRELALQVEQALRQIATPLGLRCTVIIGGVSQHRQVKELRRNPHIVIATPGRLDDLMNQKVYSLNKVGIITLDEADRMLDVGFLPQIKRVLQSSPKDRQTMLFSATMPKTIASLASAFMKTPLRVEVTPQGSSSENIKQEMFMVEKSNKMRLLELVLLDHKDDVVLIFSRTKHGAKRMVRDICNMGYSATEIHSNRSQAQRKASLEGFSKGKFRIMVATDIAARGIDVKQISLVINFDLPENSEDYVHRIGRTGRVGRSGKSISFATRDQRIKIKKIEKLIGKALPVLAHPSLPQAREEVRTSHVKRPQQSRKPAFSKQRHVKRYSPRR